MSGDATPVNNKSSGLPPSPVRPAERIFSLDVLRGFAMLGIFVMNVQDFVAPYGIIHDVPLDVASHMPHHGLDVALLYFEWVFFEGKMRALFAALFGAGTIVLLNRIEARKNAAAAADIFHRRNMWLLVFGAIHGFLIWNGDIILYYAVIALLVLYPFRALPAKRLIIIGLAISIIGLSVALALRAHYGQDLSSMALESSARTAALRHHQLTQAESAAVAHSQIEFQKIRHQQSLDIMSGRKSYLQTEPENVHGELDIIGTYFSSLYVVGVMGFMIAGMGLYKVGFFSANLPARTYRAIAIIGYSISVPLVCAGLYMASLTSFTKESLIIWSAPTFSLVQAACMLANASVILLLVKSAKFVPFQRALAAVGRTALSNYIFTSVICQFVFHWGPWKLYGEFEFYQQVYIIAAMWAINISVSLLWLRFFSIGPLEWIWRSLTYWKRQPFLLRRSSQLKESG